MSRPSPRRLLAFFGRTGHRAFQGFSPGSAPGSPGLVWPGNIRELRNAVERAAILSPTPVIGVESLAECVGRPRSKGARPGDPVSIEAIEEEHIRGVLARTKSLQEAADVLGIDAATLWRRRKKYGI